MTEYEVNIAVANDAADKFISWLPGHIQEMLLFNGFVNAECKRELNTDDPGVTNLVVRYQVSSNEDLDNYFKHHALQMRAEALALFPDKIVFKRRVFGGKLF